MNYRKVYCKIISYAKSQNRFKGDGNYYERHHILPKSLFPNWVKRKSNIVLLTAREHFFCHKLLEKIYPNSNMFLALWILANDRQNNSCSSREYQKLKERYYITEDHKANSIAATKASWADPEKRAERIRKIKEARALQKNLATGHRSAESRKNISDGTKAAMQNPELRKHLSETTKAAMNRPEMKKMLAENGKKSGILVKEKAKLYKEYKMNGGTMTWNEFQKNC